MICGEAVMTQKQTDQEMQSLIEALQQGQADNIEVAVADLQPADVARLLEGLTPEQRPAVWSVVPPLALGEVLVEALLEGLRSGRR